MSDEFEQEPQERPHRSIQDIIPPARSRPIRQQRDAVTPPSPTPPEPLDMHPNRPRGTSALVLFGLVGLIVIVLAFVAVTFLFHRADVEATVHEYDATVGTSFSTSPEDPVLPYKEITAEDTVSKSVPASGSQHVEKKATGTIIVYNAFSTKTERLITNTRFETKEGLIYRVQTPISIPGYTIKAGVKVPGSVDVTVYADQTGDKYNSDLTEFTVPGLKGTNQYELIYARSKTPMTGGFVGEQAVVDPKVRTETVDALKADLERSLRAKILAPEGYVVFPDTVTVSYSENTDTLDGTNAIVSLSGTARAPSFPMQSFAKQVASAAQVSSESLLAVANPNDLSVRLTSPDTASGASLNISVSGTAHLVSVFDAAALARDLAGKPKDATAGVLPGYPAISGMTVKIYPFWLSSIPENAKDIKVKVTPGLDQ